MKRILLSGYFILIMTVLVTAQWVEQATGFATQSRGINHLYVVSPGVAWATAYDGATTSNIVQEFTRTADGGATWTAGYINGATGLSPCMMFALDENNAWVPMYDSANGGGKLMRTSDGGSNWVQQAPAAFAAPSGFPDIVHFWDSGKGICMGDPTGGYFEIYTTTDGGDNWVRVPDANIPSNLSGEWGYTDVYSVVGNTIWFGTNKGRIFKSTDFGNTWTVFSTAINNIAYMVFVNDFKAFICNRNTTTGKYESLKMTEDGGATWQALSFTGPLYNNDMCYVPGTTNTFVSTGSDWQDPTDLGSSYSLDFCQTWTDIIPGDTVQYLAVDFYDNTTGWSGQFSSSPTMGGIMKFVDNSILTSHNNPSGNDGSVIGYRNTPYPFLPGDFVFTDPDSHAFAGIVIMSLVSTGTLKYAGNDVVLYTKCPDITQLVFTPVNEEFGYPYTAFTYKVADETGAYSDQTYTMTINVSEEYGINNAFTGNKLEAFPNPFHTDVNVTIPDDNNSIAIVLCDITGKIVRECNPGATTLVINRNGLSNGIYYLKVSGNRSYVSKLVVY